MAVLISQYMTPAPEAVDVRCTLADAQQRMNELGVRHLPVTDSGQVVGVVSSREVEVLALLDTLDERRTSIESCMRYDPLVFLPEMPLREAAKKMAEAKAGSALVMSGDQLVGIFTTVDGLRALSELID